MRSVSMMRIVSMMTVLALLAGVSTAQADVVRHPIPNSSFPISQSVEVSGNVTTHFVSGQVPPVVDKTADATSPQAYGDTKTQTVGVLNKIKGILEGLGLGMGDVVKMQVFLVNDARSAMDFKGFMEGYTQFFGGDLSRIAFNEVFRRGNSRYITAVSSQHTDTTHGLADYYGFKTGELVTDDQRNVTALRIDGADELDWLLTLGAVVRTEDGNSLRKGNTAP